MKPQLFILHHAGGNCYSYQFLMPFVTDHFEVIPTELPGRGKRVLEPLITTRDEAMMDLAMVIKNQWNGQPFITYGHSMGAILTPGIVSMLTRAGATPVACVVSGCASPVVPEGLERHKLPQDELGLVLRDMGGVPLEFFQSKELIEFFEPIVRADFKIAEEAAPAEDIPVISAPIYNIMGTEEFFLDRVEEWKQFTTGEFIHEQMEGAHFFIHNHPKALGARIKEIYDRYLVHANG